MQCIYGKMVIYLCNLHCRSVSGVAEIIPNKSNNCHADVWQHVSIEQFPSHMNSVSMHPL